MCPLLERALSVGVQVSFDNKDSVILFFFFFQWRAVHQSLKMTSSLSTDTHSYRIPPREVHVKCLTQMGATPTHPCGHFLSCFLFAFASLKTVRSTFIGDDFWSVLLSPVDLLIMYTIYLELQESSMKVFHRRGSHMFCFSNFFFVVI